MVSFTNGNPPETIEVNGRVFPIHTDFRYFILLSQKLEEKIESLNDFDFMYIGTPPEDKAAGIKSLCNFMYPAQQLPRHTSDEQSEKVTDYEIDAPYIYSAFLEQYGIDLTKARLHWYKFTALLRGLHDTKYNEIVSYRLWTNKDGENNNYTKQMQKLHDAWRLDQKEDDEEDEALNEFLQNIKK